jgi:hypothetical protein
MKTLRKNKSSLGVNNNKSVIPKNILRMTSNFLTIAKTKKTNSYLRLFDRAWQNLQIWKEEQRKHRIEKHLNKSYVS